jgi:hypothetical protein
MIVPCKCLKFFLSSILEFYSPYHHDPLICKKCSINFLVLSYTSASLDNNMYHSHVSCKYHTMVILLERGLEPLPPSTMQRLDIHYYDVLMSCIMYTKKLLSSISPYFGLIEMLDSSDPLLAPLLLDLSIDTDFLPVTGLLTSPLPNFGTFVVSTNTSNVVIVSS